MARKATSPAAGGPQKASQRPRPGGATREGAVTGPWAVASSGPLKPVSTLTGAPSGPPTPRMRPPSSSAPPEQGRHLAGEAGEPLVEAEPGGARGLEGGPGTGEEPAPRGGADTARAG